MELSIVIVNFNTKKLTQDCIDSIISTTHHTDYEIIVVDNSVKEEHKFSRQKNQENIVKVISNVENKGFGNACNIGVNNALGEYILLINSDIIVAENTIDKCIEFMKSHDATGVLGAKVLLNSGELDHGCKRGFPTPSASFYYFSHLDKLFPNNRKIGAYKQTFIDENVTSEVDAVSGSFMVIKKSVYDTVAGFDEDFFMYGEDLDLCYRIKKLGLKNIYFAQAYVTHLKGQSGLSYKSPQILFHFYNAMKIFYKKHYEKKYSRVINTIIYKAIDIKYLFAKLKM